MRAQLHVAIALGLVGLGGCRNSCQSLCVEMYEYAQECDLPVSDAELDECISAQKGKESRDDRATCNEYGDPETLRQEWSCEDLAGYWGGGNGGGGDDSGA